MLDNTERPNVEEMYVSAGNTSDLTVSAEHQGDGDVLIAAGYLKYRLGGALMRLHSEFDAAARKRGDLTETDFRLLMGRLKSLTAVLEAAAQQAALWQAARPEALALAVTAWWLDKTCRHCAGRKFQVAPGSPALTAKLCRHCQGTGEIRLPGGEMGKKLARFMDESVERARASMKKRLRKFHDGA